MATKSNVRVRVEMHTRHDNREHGVYWEKKDAFRLPNVKYFEEIIGQAEQNGFVRRSITAERLPEILAILETRLQKAKGEDAQYGAAKRLNCFKGMLSYKRNHPGSCALKIVAVKE
jgi:hypothetical protein